jgi:hypothetical protein
VGKGKFTLFGESPREVEELSSFISVEDKQTALTAAREFLNGKRTFESFF